MSLQVGDRIAETSAPVIDPRNLAIVAYEVEGPTLDERPSFVRIADIRELSDLGMIIDSSDELVGKDDVIKLGELYRLGFTPIGKIVIDTNRKKLGKVEDYTVDTDSFYIQQLSVRGGLFASLSTTGHVIHRTQITEINDTQIVVESADHKLSTLDTVGQIHRTYSNPFRKTPEATPEARESQ